MILYEIYDNIYESPPKYIAWAKGKTRDYCFFGPYRFTVLMSILQFSEDHTNVLPLLLLLVLPGHVRGKEQNMKPPCA